MDQIYTDEENNDRRQAASRGGHTTTTRRCSRHLTGAAATVVTTHTHGHTHAETSTSSSLNTPADDESQPSAKKVKLDGVRTWARSRSLPIISRDASAAGHIDDIDHVINQPNHSHFNPMFNSNSFSGNSKRKREDDSPSVSTSASPNLSSVTLDDPIATNTHTHAHTLNPASATSLGCSTNSKTASTNTPSAASQTTPSASSPPLPPVNIHSLREIDLTEIFKNPRLRHDIVFDPQLQFRPNLDGERGKRKRQSTQRYWDSISDEVEGVWAPFVNTGSVVETSSFLNLTTLFTTLRQVLVSLLPVKDRESIESDLDTELVQQQLRHHCFDFASFSRWLSNVLKAHCAPMRDNWVDQMVVRINLGWKEKNSRKLTEGLRMVFAILEAMKLDVANHQIRSLRPILVETAVDFEQDYYDQVIEKRRFDITSSCEWFANSCETVDNSSFSTPVKHYKSALAAGITQLITCNSSDFPATFGFDFARLSSFRSDLRQLTCLQLCTMLLQQLVASRRNPKATKTVSDPDYLTKFKADCLAIVSSSNGTSKWTKNIPGLALELAKRTEAVVIEKAKNECDALPSSDMITLASNWLTSNTLPSSPMYKLVEKRLVRQITAGVESRVLEVATSTSNTSAVAPLIEKVSLLTKFHWDVFSKYYIAYVESTKQ